ncbi:MAG: MBL fold metallo-hydrolase [Litoreibacter sp.]
MYYVREPNRWLVSRAGKKPDSSGSKQLLLGQRLHVDLQSETNGWVGASTTPAKDDKVQTGFIELAALSQTQLLKVFYTDVGQGDATLIEAEDTIIVIDGGPNHGFHDKLVDRLENLRRADAAIGRPALQTLHINAIFISHFDKDHYFGLVKVLKDPSFTFGTIYHNGLLRYGEDQDKGLDLGTLSDIPTGGKQISTDLRGLSTAQTLIDDNALLTNNGNLNQFGKFLQAALDASSEGRLEGFELLVKRNAVTRTIVFSNPESGVELELLAPVSTSPMGEIMLRAFPDPHNISASNPHPSPSESHTINGNSIVLRLTYGETSFLFGGDLNQPSQRYLNEKYGNLDRFAADVNKACHHGSSDFDIDYLKAINPLATVFSSGDNGSYDHPLPDAMGAAAKHSRGDFPLIFSTELARETGGGGIKFGHINARSNGQTVVMAQKKENPSKKKKWYPFSLPYTGPFHSH